MSAVPSLGCLLHRHHLINPPHGRTEGSNCSSLFVEEETWALKGCRDKYKTSFTALPLTQCSSGLPRNFFNMQSYLRICFFSLWESLGSLTSLLRKRPKCTYTYCHNFFLFIDPRWGPLLWSLKQWFLTLVVSQNLPWSLLEMQISCLLPSLSLSHHTYRISRPLSMCMFFRSSSMILIGTAG